MTSTPATLVSSISMCSSVGSVRISSSSYQRARSDSLVVAVVFVTNHPGRLGSRIPFTAVRVVA